MTVNHLFTLRRPLLALIFPLGFLASTASDAGGIPVADILNLKQNIVTASKNVQQVLQQAKQYRIQFQQYKMQLEEAKSWAEADYTWENVQDVLDNLNDITNKIEYYDDTVRDIHGYLEKFQDVAYYEHSPCFTDDGCSDAERELVEINRRNASKDQKQANDAMFEMVQKQKEQLRMDSSNLEQERQRASTAKEQKAILAHANQFALEQTKQLMQIRALLVAQQEAVSAEMRRNADEEAKARVKRKSFFNMSRKVDRNKDKGIPLTPLPNLN
jgi:P-type conjugative transfer protein trbJ